MAELAIREYESYDVQTMGKPWAALVAPNGRYNFNKVIAEYSGDLEQGTAGTLIVKNAVEGMTYATGQKNHKTKEGNMEFYHCTGNAFEAVRKEAVQEKIDRNIAGVSQTENEQTKAAVDKQVENYRKCNNIVILTPIDSYDVEKKGKPWVTEYTKDGISFSQFDRLDAKPVGRVVGNPGEYMQVIAVNPNPEQVFVVAQKDLDTKKYRMKFFEVDENNYVHELSRQAVNTKLGVENEFRPFQVEDEGKIAINMPDGYDTDKFSMWIAKEEKQADGKASYTSRTPEGTSIGNYSGGSDGQPGQFYIKEPEENAVYAVFERDYDTKKTKILAKVQHVNGQMQQQPLRSAEYEANRKIIQSFAAFDEEKFDNPYVGKITGAGKLRYANGKADNGRTLYVGGYTGRKGLGEAGDAYAWNPKDGDVFAVCQANNQTLRTSVEFYEYAKENFIEIDRETAIERAKQQEQAQAAQMADAVDDKTDIKTMQDKVKNGEKLSGEQVKHLETYRQRYSEQAASYQMVAEGSDIVLAQVGAYNSEEYRNPYITKRGANGRFNFINDSVQGEFVGGPEGGKLIVHNAKDGDVYTYGQARQDGQKQTAKYAVIEAGQAIPMEREDYQKWKKEQQGQKQAPEKQVTLADATQNLTAKGISGDKVQEELLKQGNIKEFEGKTAAQKNQLAGNAVKALEAKGKSQSHGR